MLACNRGGRFLVDAFKGEMMIRLTKPNSYPSVFNVFWLVSMAVCGAFASPPQSANTTQPHFPRIDAHAHVFHSAPEFYAMLESENIHVLDICVVDKYDRGYEEAAPQNVKALEVSRASHGRVAWCSTFDPQDWEDSGFSSRVVRDLDKTFKEGAVAVKIYKSIGEELKSRTGKYLMPDDPVFDRIFTDIEAHNKTLLAHLADETEAWRPLDPTSPHYGYFRDNPHWYMYPLPNHPSKQAILAARDHVLKQHPKLRLVGCHLASMEDDLDELGKRFDLYPNFAVDLAAKVPDLIMLYPREKVRSFLIKYQDRVLYGTDLQFMPWDRGEDAVKRWEAEYSFDWRYLATSGSITYKGREVRGLALPQSILRKVYYENALKWVPGIVASH